ncbi:LAME_0E06502g1_1 [Lachancea meyersii CBS 8951]|uniref:LAME_0E06502g1_1 n=1 Tax=Lachancea meyersii CBS 8951 TaxID=1266667 RepID=A0A1G4JHW1_9SACH|nr:LAME_0E06502g1_1 [Lachancea meyersii CBS 8951]
MDKSMALDLTREVSAPSDSVGVPAKEYTLDIPRLPSVELPLKVSGSQESVVKAVQMCGGLTKVKKALNAHKDTPEGLELRLNDDNKRDGPNTFFNEHPIIGRLVPQRDESIVMKVSLPQGTLQACGGNLQKAIASVPPNKSKIVPVGIVNNTIRFREMSDFQVRIDNVPSACEFNESLGSLEWERIQQYVQSIPDQDTRPFENINNLVVDRTSQIPSSDFQLPPPPRFSMVNIPFVYRFRANPYATKSSSGESTVRGTYLKNYQQLVHSFGDEAEIPLAAHPSLQEDYQKAQETGVYPGSNKDSKFYEKLDQCLSILHEAFAKRPIWVKRHIDGLIPQDLHVSLKIALSLVSYRFTKGPWRNTYIKFGVDPRTSAEYAKYQTEYFKVEGKLQKSLLAAKNIPQPPAKYYVSNKPGDIDSRFYFDGAQVPWYLMLQIDLLSHEPNIAEVCASVTYLKKPTELTGWFQELDLTKIRKIVKYELGCLVQGNTQFSEYKLKFFKSMLYTKESMMNKESSADADGDVSMADFEDVGGKIDKAQTKEQGNKLQDDDVDDNDDEDENDDDDDNGVESGEPDDVVLEQEENDMDDEDFEAQPQKSEFGRNESNGHDQINPAFDITTASFEDIISQISQRDSVTAAKLRKNLDGFIFESEL